jgi:hypothetical protein
MFNTYTRIDHGDGSKAPADPARMFEILKNQYSSFDKVLAQLNRGEVVRCIFASYFCDQKRKAS